MIGWTCPSCGVNYAPSVTQCCCSAVDAEKEREAKRLRQILDDWQKNLSPAVPVSPVYGPWVDPMEYWWQPPWQRGDWYGYVVRPTLTADLPNVDYLQLSKLGGRQ